jgi:hypothetical protein
VASVLGNNFYFANTTDGLKSWDGTTTSVANATMKVSMLVTHKGCLWAAGMASAPRTIYKSAFGSGTNWTLATNPVVTDPAQFVIGGAVDEPLTAIYASFQDKLMWFKSHSFGGILGSDRNDFNVRTYSDRVGTAYPETVKDCDGALRWLGGARTVWEFTGSALNKISRGIEGILAGVVQGDANARAYEITSQVDFNAGTNNLTSNAISSGDVVLSTWTAGDTSTSDFSSGVTFTHISTITIPGSIALTTQTVTADSSVTNGGFESGSGSDADNWTEGGWTRGGIAYAGSYAVFKNEASAHAVIATANEGGTGGTACASLTQSITSSWVQYTLSMSGCANKSVVVGFSVNGSKIYSDLFFASGTDLTFYSRLGPAGPAIFHSIDALGGNVVRTVSYPLEATGTFVSRTFDTGFSTPMWASSGGSWTANGHTIKAYTQTSLDGTTWDSNISWSTGASPTSSFKRYIRYQIDFSTTTGGTGTPYVSDVTLAARQSTGSYVSTSFPLGSPSGFGVFGAGDAANGGTLTYTLYTDTDATKTVVNGVPTAGSYTAKTIVTSGVIPAISTAAYAFFGSTFAITAGTQNPTLSSLILNWSEGSTLKTAAAYTNQRYWLGCAVNSTTNNRVLVYDRNHEWQRYTGINATSMTPYNGTLYFSNTSGVFQGETGYTDNGSAISAYYRTHTLAPASSHLVSTFNDLMMTMDNSPATLSTTYQVNGVSTDYSLVDYAMNTQPGIQDIRFPFPFSQVQQGKNISFKWAVSGTSFWRILGATFDFTPDRVSQ